MGVQVEPEYAPIPEQVTTNLKLNEEPLADTARYDRLHDQEVSHV